MGKITIIVCTVGLAARSMLVFALPERADSAVYVAPTNVFDAAGITWAPPVFSGGKVAVKGVLRYVPKTAQPASGITSDILFYATDVTPTNGAVIVWTDAARTNEMARFSKE